MVHSFRLLWWRKDQRPHVCKARCLSVGHYNIAYVEYFLSQMFSTCVVKFSPCILDVAYEITVYTGDVKSAGTDSVVSVTVFGNERTTPEFVLDKDESRFERGSVDLIRMDLEDVGTLLKIRIGVDGKGARPDWFLDKVRIGIFGSRLRRHSVARRAILLPIFAQFYCYL